MQITDVSLFALRGPWAGPTFPPGNRQAQPLDVYPEFKSAADARAIVTSWMPPDTRCRAHVACHDFEAWLLVGWEALLPG